MRRLALLLLVSGAFSPRLGAQEVRQQGTPLMLCAYTDSQLWEGLSGNLTAVLVAGIAHGKSLGKTPEDVGRFSGRLVEKNWGPSELRHGASIRPRAGL